MLAGVVLVALCLASPRLLVQRTGAQGKQMPVFEVDPSFFKPLPNGWVTAQGSAVAADKHDNVWWFYRHQYVPAGQKAAPSVIQFDSTGKFVQAWGGPSPNNEYEWFDQEHGIYVDDQDNVWLTGSARPALGGAFGKVLRSDNMILKFDSKGKFLMQIGKRDTSTGNNDKMNVYSATDLSVYKGEVYVADGYINHRVIVFDANTGAFKRMWGAFGNVPMDSPNQLQNARTPAGQRGGGGRGAGGGRGNQPQTDPLQAPQFQGPVHSAKVSNDGFVYVADRGANRVQVFTTEGKYVNQFRIASPSGFAISSDPEQRFLYIAEYGADRVGVVERKTLEILYEFGMQSDKPGDFQGPHELAVDTKGNLYVAEVAPGNRWQKFTFKGLSTTKPSNALTAEQLAAPAK
jgi:DNA-binding beta-propeller fold protein YncE